MLSDDGRCRIMGKNQNYLDYIPIKSNEITDYLEKENVVVELDHTGFFHWLAVKLYHVPRKTQYKLDVYGSKVWKFMNGSRTIDEIALEMRQEFGGEIEPLYERLTLFIRSLEMAGMLSCIAPNQERNNK